MTAMRAAVAAQEPPPTPAESGLWIVLLLPALGVLALGVSIGWLTSDTRDDAIIVQLGPDGKPVACWALDRCDLDVDAERVSWTCGRHGSRRYVSPPFRVAEGVDYETLGLQYKDKLCIQESGRR